MTCACSFIDMHLSALSLTASVSSFFSFFLSLSFSVLDSLFIHRELYTSTNTPHIVVTKVNSQVSALAQHRELFPFNGFGSIVGLSSTPPPRLSIQLLQLESPLQPRRSIEPQLVFAPVIVESL